MAAEPASGSAEAMQQLSQSLRSRFKEAERLQQKQSASGGLGTGQKDDDLVDVLWQALQLSVGIAVPRKQDQPDNVCQVSELRDLCVRTVTMGAPRAAGGKNASTQLVGCCPSDDMAVDSVLLAFLCNRAHLPLNLS